LTNLKIKIYDVMNKRLKSKYISLVEAIAMSTN
jgi:hypothetical protein